MLINWLKLDIKIILNFVNGLKNTTIYTIVENHMMLLVEEVVKPCTTFWVELKLLQWVKDLQFNNQNHLEATLEELDLKLDKNQPLENFLVQQQVVELAMLK